MTFVTPPLIRNFVGFDKLFDEINRVSLLKEPNYPAYNIEKLDIDNYKITVAVAGFIINKLKLETQGSLLKLTALGNEDRETIEYLHKGIAQRSFVKQFRLESCLEVKNANLKDGILSIFLVRVIPEESKKIQIEINVL